MSMNDSESYTLCVSLVLLCRYFKQSKMTSFQRQLNLYGFMRKTDGTDRGSYYHELFLRGRPDLAKIMVRTRVKGDCKRRPMAEPDFYKMPYCPEDPDPRQQQQQLHHPHHHHAAPPHGPHPHKGRLPVHRRLFYRDTAVRTPRGGYSANGYRIYGSPNEGSSEHPEDASSSPGRTPGLTPYTPQRSHAPTATHLRSSSFFLDEEPLMQAPQDSDWTPPPFPEFRPSSQQRARRERPPPQLIQPSHYPNIVSPEARSQYRPIYSHSSSTTTSPPGNSSSSRRTIVRRRPPPQPPIQSPESREEPDFSPPSSRRPPPPSHSSYASPLRTSPEPSRWTDERPGTHQGYYPPYPGHAPYRANPFRRRGSTESGIHRTQFFEGHFEPVDDTSLELFESDIHYV